MYVKEYVYVYIDRGVQNKNCNHFCLFNCQSKVILLSIGVKAGDFGMKILLIYENDCKLSFGL